MLPQFLYPMIILSITILLFFFFFSSRRRHTRLQGDWSSDVCSSDLLVRDRRLLAPDLLERGHERRRERGREPREIGRASCRGRGEISVGAGSLKKKKKKEKYK